MYIIYLYTLCIYMYSYVCVCVYTYMYVYVCVCLCVCIPRCPSSVFLRPPDAMSSKATRWSPHATASKLCVCAIDCTARP